MSPCPPGMSSCDDSSLHKRSPRTLRNREKISSLTLNNITQLCKVPSRREVVALIRFKIFRDLQYTVKLFFNWRFPVRSSSSFSEFLSITSNGRILITSICSFINIKINKQFVVHVHALLLAITDYQSYKLSDYEVRYKLCYRFKSAIVYGIWEVDRVLNS